MLLTTAAVVPPEQCECQLVQRQVQIISSLSKHEHIVAYLGSYRRADCLSIVMEYAEIGSLKEALQAQTARSQSFATDTVVLWLSQLASALMHVHAHRVLHRDIKPDNIFMAEAPLTARLGPGGRHVKLGPALLLKS